MPSIPLVRNYNLKLIFFSHFILSAISSMGYWSATSYLFYNFILILFLIWSLFDDQSHEPIQMAIVVNGLSVILDIFLLVMKFPDGNSVGERFSAAFAIIHLLVRPFTTFFLMRILDERSGAQGIMSDLFTGRRNESYEDIDNTRQPTTSAATGGYDFSSAQQI